KTQQWATVLSAQVCGYAMPASTAGPDIAAAFAELARAVASDLDIEAYLAAVCRYCVELVQVDSAAIVYLADSANAEPHVIAPDDRARSLVSRTWGTAHPCRDCFNSGQVITIADVETTADRWPVFTKAAHQAGFSAATFVPVGSQSSAR